MADLGSTAGGTARGEQGGLVKGLKSILVSGIAICLLAGSAVAVTAQDEATDGAGHEPATVSGFINTTDTDRPGGEIADGVWRDLRDTSGSLSMSDSRLSGDWAGTLGINRYRIDEDINGVAAVQTGSITIENDGGAWTGTVLGCSRCADGFSESWFIELTGTDGYEGLSGLLLVADGTEAVGLIVPGDLVPEVPADFASEQ